MIKAVRNISIGAVAVIFSLSSMVFSASDQQTITVNYNPMKVVVDGVEVALKDANGNDVRPFEYEGTNYLPLRALANAFGYRNDEITFDQETNTVYIGAAPDSAPAGEVKLSGMEYFTSSNNRAGEWQPAEEVRTNTDEYFKDCFTSFMNAYYHGESTRDYLLNGKFKGFIGTLFLTYEERDAVSVGRLNIWGDGKLLYKSDDIKGGVLPIAFDVDVSGITQLKIGFEFDDTRVALTRSTIGISQATLIK